MPAAVSFLRRVPVVGTILNLPFINKVTSFFDKSTFELEP